MESRKISRRTFLKYSMLTAVGVIASTGVYSRYMEPKRVQMTRLTLSSARLPRSFHNIRIVHISDIHYGFHMDQHKLQQIVNKINLEHADIVCFTGDLIDEGHVELRSAISVLKQLQAPFGKFAVLGNHDYRRTTPDKSTNALQEAGFKVLFNSHMELLWKGARIAIIGLEDWFGGHPDMEAATRGLREEQFKLVLAHEPDMADMIMEFPVDLQLSGHSHGGQISIPGVHSVPWNPEMGIKYPSGLYTFPSTPFRLYTTRGVGMTFMPIRLFCRPEITVITLQSTMTSD